MFNVERLQRHLLSAAGALLLSVTFVGAAVAPAQAGEPQAAACLLVSHA
jgi:hypothetical protein